MLKILAALIPLFVSMACFAAAERSVFEERCAKIAASSGSDAKRLHELFSAAWKYQNTEFPEDGTFNGYPGVNANWTDLSIAAIGRRHREIEAPLKAIRKINRSRLTASDQLNYDLFRRDWEEALEGRDFPDEYLQINQLSGVHQMVPQVLAAMPTSNAKDLADIIARLEKVPHVVEQSMILLEEGLKRGVTPPRITLRDVPDQVKALFEEDPSKNALLASLRKHPAQLERAAKIVRERVIPAYRKLHEFLAEKYIPATRETIAWTALPSGPAWYTHRVRHSTTTKLSPSEIHQIGLREVARIRKEMDAVIAKTGFKGDFEEFKTFMREDSRFFFETREELLRNYRDIAKRVDPELINLFGKLPRLPYGVVPVPSYAEKSQPTAYYEPGSPEAGRPGNFFANTYDLKTRPKWEMEALTLHEAVPGHHLQIALAQELENVPDFRRFGGYTAFVEGWGLYAESLGERLGLYEDPYSKFGQLTYEMWRAVRLVVDTGMHSLGWSREQAINFFKENTGKSEHDITVEVDRYIVWAGQALAYKIGQLKFSELRARAEKKLGDKFSIRVFHDLVLGQGALPLDALENLVNDWIAKQLVSEPARAHAARHH